MSGRASPRSTPATSHHLHLTPAEQLMNQRLHEFGDSRGIMAGGGCMGAGGMAGQRMPGQACWPP